MKQQKTVLSVVGVSVSLFTKNVTRGLSGTVSFMFTFLRLFFENIQIILKTLKTIFFSFTWKNSKKGITSNH